MKRLALMKFHFDDCGCTRMWRLHKVFEAFWRISPRRFHRWERKTIEVSIWFVAKFRASLCKGKHRVFVEVSDHSLQGSLRKVVKTHDELQECGWDIKCVKQRTSAIQD